MFFNKKITERIDWFGVASIIVAFTLNSFGIIQATSYLYIALNIVGSGCIAAISFRKHDLQPMTLNLIWMLVAVVALFRALVH